jgi:hypothetical protein
MPSLDSLGSEFTLALNAKTVRPSRTVAALATLATGLAPVTHGLIEPGLGFLRRLPRLKPLARELARAGIPSRIVASELPVVERSVVRALASAAGVGAFTWAGQRARDVARAALDLATAGEEGVIFVYLNDADCAGHADGWMSTAYLNAAIELDRAVGLLSPLTDDSLLLVFADHGGGGVTATDHHEPHAVNDAIPLVLAGPGVTRRHQLTRPVSILDVPPTVCRWFGVTPPDCYEGRALDEAFTNEVLPAGVPT